jgi:hypothetical protein
VLTRAGLGDNFFRLAAYGYQPKRQQVGLWAYSPMSAMGATGRQTVRSAGRSGTAAAGSSRIALVYLRSRWVVRDIWSDHTYNKGVVDVRIFASVTFVALLSATAPALADQFEWGPLTTRPRNDQNTIWDAHCNDSSEHVVSGQCTISSGSGTLQNVGVNDERDTWTCVWGETVKASARALCAK